MPVIAKDGKPYDIDCVGELREGEVEVLQFLRPDGKRRRMAANVGKEYVEKAKDLILTVEVLNDGHVVVYGKHKDDGEGNEKMLMTTNDGKGETPTDILKEVIDIKYNEYINRES